MRRVFRCPPKPHKVRLRTLRLHFLELQRDECRRLVGVARSCYYRSSAGGRKRKYKRLQAAKCWGHRALVEHQLIPAIVLGPSGHGYHAAAYSPFAGSGPHSIQWVLRTGSPGTEAPWSILPIQRTPLDRLAHRRRRAFFAEAHRCFEEPVDHPASRTEMKPVATGILHQYDKAFATVVGILCRRGTWLEPSDPPLCSGPRSPSNVQPEVLWWPCLQSSGDPTAAEAVVEEAGAYAPGGW